MNSRILTIMWLFFFGVITAQQSIFAEPALKSPKDDANSHKAFAHGEIVIETHPGTTLGEIDSLIKGRGGKIIESSSPSGIYRIQISESIGDTTISYQSHPAVKHAQPNYIFAQVGYESITLFDLKLTIQRMVPILRQRYAQLQFKESLLRSLLNDKLFSQAAKEEGFQSIPEVQREIRQAVEKTLAQIYEKKIKAGTVSEQEMRLYYENNSEKFQAPEQIRGRRILLNSKKEALEVFELIKAGADFGNLARARSIDPDRQKGGSFGWIGRGRMAPEIEATVFALKKGEITDILQVQSGYSIIKIEDKRAPRLAPFSEVKGKIRRRLNSAKQKVATDKKTRELEVKYQVKLNTAFLSEVKVPVTEKIDMRDSDSIQMLRDLFNKAIERPY